jgi:TPP-dependent pyruvate/acetoin dehydrogenase alpha subunit
MDVEAVAAVAGEAYAGLRRNLRPVFVELETYRYNGHNSGEKFLGMKYRTDEEIQQWRERDPLDRARLRIPDDSASVIESEIEKEIEDAVEFARSSPFPDAATALDYMYAKYPEGGLS